MTTWLQITSGRGPDECCRVAGKLLKGVLSKARNQGIDIHLLEAIPEDEKDTIKSALVLRRIKQGLYAFYRQHFLYFFPLPQGQGSFLPIFVLSARVSGAALCC